MKVLGSKNIRNVSFIFISIYVYMLYINTQN